MRTQTIVVLGIGLVMLGGSVQAAEPTLKEKRQRAQQEEALGKEVDSTNKHCGTSLTATLDWASFPAKEIEKYSPSGFCESALEGIRGLCGDEMGKAAVQKIKKVACAFGGKGKRAVTLKDDTLSYVIDWDASNSGDFVKKYLENSL